MINTYIKINRRFQPAVMSLATSDDLTRLLEWLGEYRANTDPQTGDTLEYVVDSINKLGKYTDRGRCATDWTGFLANARSAAEEVAGLLVLKCAAFGDEIVGFVFLRRLWDRGLVMDYLAKCPPGNPRLQGVGSVGAGLLLGTCKLAKQLRASSLWWETTQLSHGFYLKMLTPAAIKFGVRQPKSTLIISKRAYLRFTAYMESLLKP